MKKTSLSLFLSLFVSLLYAQTFDEVVIKTTKVTESIYMLEGAGGNIGVCIGEDGVFVIDDQFEALGDRITTAISKLSDKPIQFVINTHYHGDHAGGNQYFGESGAIIFAHENARKRIEADLQKKVDAGEKTEVRKSALPRVTMKEAVTFHYNQEVIKIIHKGKGHTDGDVIIYFSKSNVFHMGDLFVRYGFPYVDMGAGGDVPSMIASLDYVLSLSDESSQFIPGHGQLANKADVTQFRDMLFTITQRVITEKAKGIQLKKLNIDDMTKGYEEIPGNFSSFISAIYNSGK